MELDGDRVTVDPGQHLGQSRVLGVAERRRSRDVCDDFTAARDGQLGEIDDGLVGPLAAQQTHRLGQQRLCGFVHAA